MKLLFFDISTDLYSIHDLETRPRGGMISSLFILTDELSKAGHEVAVLSDITLNGETRHGVRWTNDKEIGDCQQWDILVCNRTTTDDGLAYIPARRRVLWTHDLPHAGFIPKPNLVRAFDTVVFMSRYAERVWRTFYPLIRKSVIIPNGVAKTLFYPRAKDLDYLIFGSAPNRGLHRLPLIFEALKNRVRKNLYMKAFSNMGVLHPNENRRATSFWEDQTPLQHKECEEAGIDLQDPIPQREWAKEVGKAGLMILPTQYPEICSNVILQSLASGTPVVTTGNLGSAGEWIRHKHNGMLTEFLLSDYMVHTVEMVRNAKWVLEDKKRHMKMIRNAEKTKNLHTWEEIAKRWDRMLCRGL